MEQEIEADAASDRDKAEEQRIDAKAAARSVDGWDRDRLGRFALRRRLGGGVRLRKRAIADRSAADGSS